MQTNWVGLALAFCCGMLSSVAMSGFMMGGEWEKPLILAVLAALGAALSPKL